MKRIRWWHGRWLLIAAVLGLSVGGSGQWVDRRQQSFSPAIALPHGLSPGGVAALGSMGWAGSGRANRAEPDAGLSPKAGADGQYRVIDASRYDRQLQREHERILCQGHRVLWRLGEQLREEALDSIQWSAAGGVVGRAVKTALKSARQAVRHGQNAHYAVKGLVFPKQTTVIGSRVDTLAAKGWPEHNVLDIPTWSAKENIMWLDSAIRRGDEIYLATDPARHAAILDSLSTRPYSAFLDLELPYLQWRGYVQEGVRMIPKAR